MFPPPDPRTGFAVRRFDLALDLDLVAITLTGHRFPPHVHGGYAIALIESGRLVYQCGGRIRVVGPGGVSVVAPGEVHTGHADPTFGPARYWLIHPTADLVRRLTGFVGELRSVEVADAEASAAYRALIGAAAGSSESRRGEVLGSSLVRIVRSLGGPGERPRVAPAETLARQVRAYLFANLARRPTLEELAPALDRHPAYLRRVFRRVIGLPPQSYLVQLRVMRARQLLARGEPIARTAVLTGFVDQSHLTRHFRRVMGLSPGRFRHQVGFS